MRKRPELIKSTLGNWMRASADVHRAGVTRYDYSHEIWVFHWGPILVILPRSWRSLK